MSRISIVDLEVFYSVGITAEERARAQRLLITVDLDFDFARASQSDRIEQTIDYKAIADRLLAYGTGRSWNLLEKLVTELADMILSDFHPETVRVEVKKFPIPQARYVLASVIRSRI